MTTSFSSKELDAINYIIGAVGQAPVTNVDTLSPDIAIAYDTLIQTNKQVQAEGWHFNTEKEYPFTPDNNGDILIPANVLQLDLSHSYANLCYDPVIRDGKLYDKKEHTYTWTEQVECDVLWLIPFDDVPQPISHYIVTKAATHASQKLVGTSELFELLSVIQNEARANALTYDTQQGDHSFFGDTEGMQYYQSFVPYKSLER